MITLRKDRRGAKKSRLTLITRDASDSKRAIEYVVRLDQERVIAFGLAKMVIVYEYNDHYSASVFVNFTYSLNIDLAFSMELKFDTWENNVEDVKATGRHDCGVIRYDLKAKGLDREGGDN